MANIENFIEEKLEEIDGQIQKIDNHKVVRAAEELLRQKARLQAARRALLGAGPTTSSNGGTRMTQAELVKWFESNPGQHGVGDIASALGQTEAVVRGHLNRGKDERFRKFEDGEWGLRDPENEEDEDG